jgi:hypothetical protein
MPSVSAQLRGAAPCCCSRSVGPRRDGGRTTGVALAPEQDSLGDLRIAVAGAETAGVNDPTAPACMRFRGTVLGERTTASTPGRREAGDPSGDQANRRDLRGARDRIRPNSSVRLPRAALSLSFSRQRAARDRFGD